MLNCEVCKKEVEQVFKEKFGAYTLWECSVCHVQFWTPMKNPGAEWYEKDERYSFRNRDPLKTPEVDHREFLKDSPTPRGRVLDVGMGTGNFLKFAMASGYQGYGIDFDHDAVSTAEKTFGLKNVCVLDLDGALIKFGENFFDAVTLFQVLEHLDQPKESISKIRRLLKPGGYLAISVPYRNAPDYLKPHDKPPRHLTRWNRTAMKNFLENQGFEVARMKIIPVSIPYLITKFHFWFKKWTSFNLVQKIAGDSKMALSAVKARRVPQLQKLARIKDYVLFSIPALVLYVYFRLVGRNGLGLYVLARL